MQQQQKEVKEAEGTTLCNEISLYLRTNIFSTENIQKFKINTISLEKKLVCEC